MLFHNNLHQNLCFFDFIFKIFSFFNYMFDFQLITIIFFYQNCLYFYYFSPHCFSYFKVNNFIKYLSVILKYFNFLNH